MNRRKIFFPVEQQASLLAKRGLLLPQRSEAQTFLTRHNYYRFSGYMRYFQTDLASGNTAFKPGTHWDEIADIYYLDSTLRTYLLRGIQAAEVAIRSAFSLSECSLHSPYEQYLQTNAYKPPKSNRVQPTDVLISSELDRSREPFIQKYRDDTSRTDNDWKKDVPVWAAVEALSLGTLSKAIQFRNDGNAVYSETCKILEVGKPFLATQMRSFTFIRNKCAHSSRLWNSYVLDQPSIPRGVKQRANDLIGGTFDANSVMAVIIALDFFLERTKLQSGFLDGYLKLVEDSPAFHHGITHPRNS